MLTNVFLRNGFQNLCKIRVKLHIPSETEGSGGTTQGNSRSNSDQHADIALLIFSAVKMSLLLNKHLTVAWLKVPPTDLEFEITIVFSDFIHINMDFSDLIYR